jgi:hypothetical protein
VATIQENVDIQAFTLYNMGFKELPKLNNFVLSYLELIPAVRYISSGEPATRGCYHQG